VAVILGFVKASVKRAVEGAARGAVEGAARGAVKGAVEEGIKVQTLTVLVSKDTANIKAIAVAVGYQVTMHLMYLLVVNSFVTLGPFLAYQIFGRISPLLQLPLPYV
jgi:hypothetical protein